MIYLIRTHTGTALVDDGQPFSEKACLLKFGNWKYVGGVVVKKESSELTFVPWEAINEIIVKGDKDA